MGRADTIDIGPCPLCGGVHHYALRVERSKVSHFMPAGDEAQEKSFVRLFVCPKENEHYQSTLSLIVEPGWRIKSVEVGGMVEDPDG